ncbi:GNAT family N-acetyltransferase [Paractinoplanes maris]|uniref:GNAT family N-acetyltransferase n=1 Tax=Paractinoplanes maris TaxID=1734446 RepID=UPI0034DB2C8E
MTVILRKATLKDFEALVGLREEARQWLIHKGTDQWQPKTTGRLSLDQVRSGIARSIAQGTCYVALDGEDLVGTITVDKFADPEFWTDDDNPNDALYAHRMIVGRHFAGKGIGAQMLDYASKLAPAAGKRWLRLDAWRTNDALHRYYTGVGFDHVRTVNLHHRGSGALFQRLAAQAESCSRR